MKELAPHRRRCASRLVLAPVDVAPSSASRTAPASRQWRHRPISSTTPGDDAQSPGRRCALSEPAGRRSMRSRPARSMPSFMPVRRASAGARLAVRAGLRARPRAPTWRTRRRGAEDRRRTSTSAGMRVIGIANTTTIRAADRTLMNTHASRRSLGAVKRSPMLRDGQRRCVRARRGDHCRLTSAGARLAHDRRPLPADVARDRGRRRASRRRSPAITDFMNDGEERRHRAPRARRRGFDDPVAPWACRRAGQCSTCSTTCEPGSLVRALQHASGAREPRRR